MLILNQSQGAREDTAWMLMLYFQRQVGMTQVSAIGLIQSDLQQSLNICDTKNVRVNFLIWLYYFLF